MPANKKHLSTPIQRFAKITAGFVGGYMVTQTFHMFLMLWFDNLSIMMTLRFGGFIVWVGLLVWAFLSKNGWKIWGIYLLITLFFYLFIFFYKG